MTRTTDGTPLPRPMSPEDRAAIHARLIARFPSTAKRPADLGLALIITAAAVLPAVIALALWSFA